MKFRAGLLLALAVWTAAAPRLLTHTSSHPIILGRFSVTYAALLAVYAVAWLAGLVLLSSPPRRLLAASAAVRRHRLLGFLLVGTALVLIGAVGSLESGLLLPPFSLVLPVAVVTVLFVVHGAESGWARRVLAYAGYLLLTVELVLQLAAGLGLLPGLKLHDPVPYGRVYQTVEGRANSLMNRYGWYYPSIAAGPSAPFGRPPRRRRSTPRFNGERGRRRGSR